MCEQPGGQSWKQFWQQSWFEEYDFDVPAAVKVSRMLGFCLATLCTLLRMYEFLYVRIYREKQEERFDSITGEIPHARRHAKRRVSSEA